LLYSNLNAPISPQEEGSLTKAEHKSQILITTALCFAGLSLTACQGDGRRARLESYRSLALKQKIKLEQNQEQGSSAVQKQEFIFSARLSASSTTLTREDLLPCESLPPRKLTYGDGRVSWLDGSWARQARAYIVKGSAETESCHLEIRPWGHVNINPGGKDAFIRGRQIHILLSNPNGETFIPPNTSGLVRCSELNGKFQITTENAVIGNSPISYVTNEGVPLELASKVCLARILSSEQVPQSDWAIVIPALHFNASLKK
jgi:hypothetical protein